MIGPGTGIAPFISLLRELHATMEDPKRRPPYLWLFYGCRKPHWDWLFGEELSKTLRPLLERISITFSRVSEEELSDIEAHTPGCRYVQDAMRKYSSELVQWIHERNATVYVCGDAKNMAKDVNVCMVECLHKHLGLSPEEAHKYLNDMIKTKRLKQDIWA
jgi:sulfite reductase alpha subunit-like flavoprotein